MKKSDKMRKLMAELADKKPKKKVSKKKAVESKKAVEIELDVNKDGEVDEKDLSLLEKVKKKIVKKKED